MDELDWGPGLPAAPTDARRFQRWSKAACQAIVERTAAGESLRAICRDPELPNLRVVTNWMKTRPAFARQVRDARAKAARAFAGRTPAYCQATAEIIFERLCEGEGVAAICRDPDMPAPSTVYRWMALDRDFREAVALAREIAAEGVFAKGFEISEGATPETAYLAHVRLTHLRWGAAKLAPRKYGVLKPQEAEDADTDKVDMVTVCSFKLGPNNEVLRIPPINDEDERRWISAYGKPYDGPRAPQPWRRASRSEVSDIPRVGGSARPAGRPAHPAPPWSRGSAKDRGAAADLRRPREQNPLVPRGASNWRICSDGASW